jgi:apolipoprotein N-acyltransferase
MTDRKWGFLWLGAGSLLFAFVGWKWNQALAAWVAPVFLVRYFRGCGRWRSALLAYPALVVSSFLKFSGTWAQVIGMGVEMAVSAALPLPLLAALAADRFLIHRAPGWASALVLPAGYVLSDFAFGHIPSFGTAGSIAISQFFNAPGIQLASLAGIWGISFVVLWVAAAFAGWWAAGFPSGKPALPLAAAVLAAGLLSAAGGLRLTAFSPACETVKIAGVAVGHERDYWNLILDRGVPAGEAVNYSEELDRLQDVLFRRSEQAAAGGAEIVFWSEASLFVYEDGLDALLEKAGRFARGHRLYFAPSLQVLHFGSTRNDNRAVLFAPDGTILYTYKKRMSLYDVDSDAVIHFADTPHGRIASAICFDMDFPSYVRQAGKKAVDILLVPAYDTQGGSPYHSYVGLLRAVENGFSVFRSVSNGTSMAVDCARRVVGRQDFFHSRDGVFFADLPVKGVRTPYSRAGDWLVGASLGLLAGLLLRELAASRRRRRRPPR